MKKTKIFIFCPSLGVGGMERVLSTLSYSFANHYDEVTYILWYDKAVFYEIDKRIKIISAEKECGSGSFWRKMIWLSRYVKSQKPDVLISFSAPFNMIALASLMGRSGIKMVVAERNDPAHFRWGVLRYLRNWLYCFSEGIIAQTDTCKTHLCKKLAMKCVVIPNPILMDDAYKGAALSTVKERQIVSVARFVPQKRLDILIRSFASFERTHPGFHLYIYGDGKDKASLLLLISELQLVNKVLICPVVNDIFDRIKKAEMFVMTSAYEGMSNALMEAMCLGLPCISTRVSGAVEMINDGYNGVLVDIEDHDGIVKAMCDMADNPAQQLLLGENAMRIYDTYHVSSVARQWLDYIDSFTCNAR